MGYIKEENKENINGKMRCIYMNGKSKFIKRKGQYVNIKELNKKVPIKRTKKKGGGLVDHKKLNEILKDFYEKKKPNDNTYDEVNLLFVSIESLDDLMNNLIMEGSMEQIDKVKHIIEIMRFIVNLFKNQHAPGNLSISKVDVSDIKEIARKIKENAKDDELEFLAKRLEEELKELIDLYTVLDEIEEYEKKKKIERRKKREYDLVIERYNNMITDATLDNTFYINISNIEMFLNEEIRKKNYVDNYLNIMVQLVKAMRIKKSR